MKEKLKLWFDAAKNRAIRTMAQTAASQMSSAAVLQDVNWLLIVSAVILSGIVSFATSIVGLPELDENHCNRCWAAAAGIRAVKTMAQNFVSAIGSSYALQDINWMIIASSTILAGIYSIATSIATRLPEVDYEDKETGDKTEDKDNEN